MNDRLAQSLANDDRQAVADTTEQLLTGRWSIAARSSWLAPAPATPRLLTLKGLQQIQQADVVVMTGWFPTTS